MSRNWVMDEIGLDVMIEKLFIILLLNEKVEFMTMVLKRYIISYLPRLMLIIYSFILLAKIF